VRISQQRLSVGLFLISVLVAGSFLMLHSIWRYNALNRLQGFSRVEQERQRCESLTYPDATPRILLENDGYLWIEMARTMVREGTARVRHTSFDNAPTGRAVYWSSGFGWWLVGLGALDAVVSGQPIRFAIERMAIIANPLLLFFAGVLLVWGVGRRWGAMAGFTIVAGLVGLPQLFWTFYAGRPDHHGLISLAALGTLLPLALGGAGWVENRGGHDRTLAAYSGARRCFLISAVCGGIALWTSAISGCIVLFATGTGALAAILLVSDTDNSLESTFRPELWRVWGITGATVTILFYVLEYMPSRITMRLEVIHPLYAVAWWGGGELLFRIGQLRAGFQKQHLWREWVIIAFVLGSVFVLPVAVWIGGAEWCGLLSPLMWRLHHFIDEFRPYCSAVGLNSGAIFVRDFGGYLMVALVGVFMTTRRLLPSGVRAILVFTLVPCIILLSLMLWQYRWGSLFSVTLLTATAYILGPGRVVFTFTSPRWHIDRILVLLIICQAVWFVAEELIDARQAAVGPIPAEMGRAVIVRDVAQELQKYANGRDVVVLGNPNDMPAFCYAGGFRTLGTFYWENVAGIRAAADILTATDPDISRVVMQQHGVTHIVLFTDRHYIGKLLNIRSGKRAHENLEQTFGSRLLTLTGRPFTWLRPLIYQMPFPALSNVPGGVAIYEVCEIEE